MPTGRRKARREAVFALYRGDLLRKGAEVIAESAENDDTDTYASRILAGVQSSAGELDHVLSQHVRGWSLARLGVLERAILRVAAYELSEEPGVPVAVIVDEAVGLAKRYCSAEAGSLVNGILSGAAAALRPAEVDAAEGTEK